MHLKLSIVIVTWRPAGTHPSIPNIEEVPNEVTRFLIVLICLIGVAAFADNEKDRDKKKTEIRQMSQQTLARLYKAEPFAKTAVQN